MARRRRYTWFPTLGTTNIVPNSNPPGRELILGVANNGGANIITVPLTFDQPQEALNANVTAATPLADFLGNEYIVERIIGNMYVNLATSLAGTSAGEAQLNASRAIMVTAGLFVARADDTNQDDPVGAGALIDELRNYSPANVDNIREPWMFRRTWLLGRQLGVDTSASVAAGALINSPSTAANRVEAATGFAYPQGNVSYGTAAGGPFVDVKAARRIGKDERLFWTLACQTFPTGAAVTGTWTIVAYFDYRILGMLIKAKASSSF